MKKTRRVLMGVLLSLAMALSGIAGVTAQLHPVYADEENTDQLKPYLAQCKYGEIGSFVPEKGYSKPGTWYLEAQCITPIDGVEGLTAETLVFGWCQPFSEDTTNPDNNVNDVEYVEYPIEDNTEYTENTLQNVPEGGNELSDQNFEYDSTEAGELPEGNPAESQNNEAELPEGNPAEGQNNEFETNSTEVGILAEGTEVEAPAEGAEFEAPVESFEGEVPAEGAEFEAPAEGIEVEDPMEVAVVEEGAPAEVTAVEEEVPAEVTAVEEEAPAEAPVVEETAPAEKDETEEAVPAAEPVEEKEEAAEAGEDAEVAPAEEKAEEAKDDDDLLKAPDKFIVTFDVQGHGEAPKAQEVEDGSKAEKPEDPAAEGYDFGGWFTDKECTTAFDFTTEIKANTTVYAKWTIRTFTVSFATTRGTAPAAQTVNYGETAAQPALTDVGYTCTGWTLDGTAFDFSTPVRTDLTLTAVWRPNEYTIHFDPNNSAFASAAGATADLKCTYDVEASLNKNGFTRNADWQFIGWNTAANGSGTSYADGAAVKNLTAEDGATVTMYAQWRFIYKMVSGAGASVSKLDTRGLTFQTNGFFSLFTGVAVDGTVINANNYTASDANYGTYVTLKQAFIQTLSIGQHTIQFLYSDGSVSTTFYVNNSTILNAVKTGDNSKTAMWMSLLAGAAVLAVGLGILKKKFRF